MPRGKKAGKGGVNKMEAVRQVIAKHGKETMPVEIVKFVKEEHGADMTAEVASNYKSAALKHLGLRGKRKAKRGPKPGWKKAAAATDGAKTRTASNGLRIEDIEEIKKLCDRLGGQKVQDLARVLAK